MPWLRHLAVLFAFLSAFARPAPASAFTPASLETRVGGFEVAGRLLVGETGAASLDTHQGIGAAYDENASGYRVAAGGAGQAAGRGSAARGLKAPEHGTFHVDPKGNVVPTPPGGRVTGSPDGRFIQARDAAGNPTGVRIDGPHKPASHPDPRAQVPHGHVPGVTNPDGTPWLPINQ